MAGIFREWVIKRFTRSSKWSKCRRAHLIKHPRCICCGKKKVFGMQVHHIVPFHVDPSLELVESNLATLCNNPRCHLDKGHLGNWRSWNWNVIEDCATWLWKYETRPYKNRG